MLEVSQDLCNLLDADRLTIYMVSEDRQTIVSKVKTGLTSFKDLKLPINEQSIAGYVAVHKRPVNLKDVYDDRGTKELQAPHSFSQGGGQAHRLPHAANARCADRRPTG